MDVSPRRPPDRRRLCRCTAAGPVGDLLLLGTRRGATVPRHVQRPDDAGGGTTAWAPARVPRLLRRGLPVAGIQGTVQTERSARLWRSLARVPGVNRAPP